MPTHPHLSERKGQPVCWGIHPENINNSSQKSTIDFKLTIIRPGPRFEPGSEDPQSSRITNYPTLADVLFTFAPDSD
jgi:hypothetical protein